MEEVTKIAVIALIGACLCMVLRSQVSPFALIVSLASCVGILLVSIRFFLPVISVFQRLNALSGLADSITAPVLKSVGIGILSQIAASVCEDSGEKALAKTVEVGSSLLAIYVSVPLFFAVLDMLERLLGEGA